MRKRKLIRAVSLLSVFAVLFGAMVRMFDVLERDLPGKVAVKLSTDGL